jgi:hypothetical protein
MGAQLGWHLQNCAVHLRTDTQQTGHPLAAGSFGLLSASSIPKCRTSSKGALVASFFHPIRLAIDVAAEQVEQRVREDLHLTVEANWPAKVKESTRRRQP